MALLLWDQDGERTYETGVDHGVLYYQTTTQYDTGVAWNGLVTVTETPSGAEANAQYADNIKYLNLISAEDFAATVEAFTYPVEFEPFDGLGSPTAGMTVNQQSRGVFGLSYRTKVGNDQAGDSYSEKIHCLYGCQATPSEKAYSTINDSPEAITFSWEINTSPTAVGNLNGTDYTPCSLVTLDKTLIDTEWQAIIDELWGDMGGEANLPLPPALYTLAGGT